MHEPVLLQEVVEWLAPRPGATIVDATVGAGGHAEALLERAGPGGQLLGLDRDWDALGAAAGRLAGAAGRWTLQHARFGRLAEAAREAGIERADAVLFDVGISSLALDRAERGFSFSQEGPLDMRMDRRQGRRAADIVREADVKELTRLFRAFGELPEAQRVARAIVRARAAEPIETTGRLVAAVRGALPAETRNRSLARVFQSLRIAVNDEIEELRAALPQALHLLAPGGRLAVISFHSLEDRIVKEFVRIWQGACSCPPDLPVCVCGRRAVVRDLTRGVVRPSAEEVSRNPRARSARLRVAIKLEEARASS